MTVPLVVKMHPTQKILWYVDVTVGKPDRYVAPYYGPQPQSTPTVVTQKGDPGPSAYQLAQSTGYPGTLKQWLASLQGNGAPGLSAYQVALASGFQGSQQQWLDSLKAPSNGGANGLSAFQLAQQVGFTGTQAEWLVSLRSNVPGKSAFEIAQGNGFQGTQADWLASLKSTVPSTVPGKSAYELAQAAGFQGSQAQWLDSLRSTAPSTVPGKSAFEIAQANGFQGTQAQWLASLQGTPGVSRAGNYVGANPVTPGPVLVVQNGAYATANPNMLGLLASQLYLKGTDGLYGEGLVPVPWPEGTVAGQSLILQASSAGSNLLWLGLNAQIPATLGTVDNAYVKVGTTGMVKDTVMFRPSQPLFDDTVKRTADRFLAATYPSTAAFEAVYTKLGMFTPYLYDQADAPVSGRQLELDTGGTPGVYGYLRSSYPTGAATFATGSITALGKKGGGQGCLIAILLASGSGSTYTALEARLSTASGDLRLYSVVNGVSNPLGAGVAKAGLANDAYWWIRLYRDAVTNAVRARAWAATATEPSGWDIDTTQTTVTAAGLAGIRTDLSYGRFNFIGISRGDALAPTG